jgi:Xaa-Pro aminopeptidase
VACFGNVHEGPISISLSGTDYGFKANMVTSNEPGIYKEGKYGIRIENLQYTTPVEGADGFLEFKYLTKVPIDKKLIDKYLLNGDELMWLNKYHADVYESLAPYLNESEKIWLKNACSPL